MMCMLTVTTLREVSTALALMDLKEVELRATAQVCDFTLVILKYK